jgi:hypothetical protein
MVGYRRIQGNRTCVPINGLRRCSAVLLGSGGASRPIFQLDPQVNVRIGVNEVKEILGAWAYGHARAVSAL